MAVQPELYRLPQIRSLASRCYFARASISCREQTSKGSMLPMAYCCASLGSSCCAPTATTQVTVGHWFKRWPAYFLRLVCFNLASAPWCDNGILMQRVHSWLQFEADRVRLVSSRRRGQASPSRHRCRWCPRPNSASSGLMPNPAAFNRQFIERQTTRHSHSCLRSRHGSAHPHRRCVSWCGTQVMCAALPCLTMGRPS